MYRTRVEKISGKKIFADGKWLTCIGNKTFHVGDLIYTDGRCVYGYNKESQQPLVIQTLKPDDVIPIVTNEGCFIFDKGKLICCSTEQKASYNKCFVNNKRGDFFLISNFLFLPTNEDAYLYGTISAYAVEKYGQDVPEREYNFYREPFLSDLKGVLAADVDTNGNLFVIFIDEFTLSIRKNNDIISEIDLKELIEKAMQEVEQPAPPAPESHWGHHGNPASPGDWMIWNIKVSSVEFSIRYAFIENENNYFVYIVFYCGKSSTTTHGDREESISADNLAYINCYISKDEIILKLVDEPSPYIPKLKPDSNQKIPLQNNYFFTEKTTDDKIERTFYSPSNQKIFSDSFQTDSLILAFAKIKNGYLLNFWANDKGHHSYIGNRHALQFITNQKSLLSESVCYNLKFRAIKKNKVWQNHIQKITLG